jgi:hypothetical protein
MNFRNLHTYRDPGNDRVRIRARDARSADELAEGFRKLEAGQLELSRQQAVFSDQKAEWQRSHANEPIISNPAPAPIPANLVHGQLTLEALQAAATAHNNPVAERVEQLSTTDMIMQLVNKDHDRLEAGSRAEKQLVADPEDPMTEINRLERLERQLAVHSILTLPEPDLPDDDELTKLMAIVEKAWPQLVGAEPTEVRNGLIWASHAFKRPGLNSEFYPTTLMDGARSWLKGQGYHSSLSLRAFLSSVIASGDIPYSDLSRFPWDIELGVTPVSERAQPSSKWHTVLSTRKVLPPTLLDRPLVDMRRPSFQMLRTSAEEDNLRSPVRIVR